MLRRISPPYMFILAAIVTMVLAAGGVWQFARPMEEMLHALIPTWVGIVCVFLVLWRQMPPADAANTPHCPARGGAGDFELLKLNRRYTDISRMPLVALDYVAIDIKTSHTNTVDDTDRDAVLQISAVRITDGKVVSNDSFTRQVDLGQPIAPTTSRFQSITDDTLKINRLPAEFRDYLGNSVLVGHNVARDLALIGNFDEMSNPVLDTMLLSMGAFEERSDHTLDALAEYFDEKVHSQHTPAGYADLIARVFLRLLPDLDRVGAHYFGDAQDLCAYSAGRIWGPGLNS